ncbi:MAG TPA: hypothetical protein VNA25_05175 [Phycisphaerae bacterium]|nr:hypothetical protein [Phycisphaerae bacterium]
MFRKALFVGLLAAVVVGLPARSWSQDNPAAAQAAGAEVKKLTFDNKEALAGWTITGDVTVDMAKAREGTGGALKVGPGGKAVLKLRASDASGKVEMWVHDDGTVPENAKASRVGPRWGLVQGDGKLLAVGILYAAYLGGNEGYTATASNGRSWFNQLFWLGVNRKPGWHKWTLDFDPTKGIQVFHNDKAVDKAHFDSTKAGLKGFSAIVIWGDGGKGKEQTIWVDDVSVTLGGAVKSVPQPKPVAPTVEGPNPWVPSDQKVVMYTKDNPPATPKLEDLPLKGSVSQYGITWTFEKPARVGQFVNGDWYVVGPVTVKALDPKPLYGDEIPEIELDHMDLERAVAQRVRNGFMLNPPAKTKVAYDSGIRNWWDPSLIGKLPVAMKAGDSLVATISMPKGLILRAQLRNKIERGKGDSSPIRTAAVLTCVGEPQPPDAFRPSYCDRTAEIYLSRNLKRELLPTAAATKSTPKIGLYVRFNQRPWLATGFFGFEEPVENMPQYGLEFGRVAGLSALMLCTDLKPAEKETLLVDYVQVGIDLGGIARAGHPGWEGFGGHGSGRKLPIVFAGLLLGDEQLANVNKSFPKVSFGEDEQTAYGESWTGAKVVFAGHRAIDARTGIARPGTGPYEHKHPSKWTGGDNTSEGYRRCCTSVGWVAQGLVLRLMKAEKAWGHDAFLDYVDRWMYENDGEFVKVINKETGRDHDKDWSRQEQTWEPFVNEMWAKYRTGPGMPPTDGWKKQHDDSYLNNAMEKAKPKD